MGGFSNGETPDPLLQTHYEVLGVVQTSSFKEIKDAFVKRSKQVHPDVNQNPRSHQEFLKVNEAYSILSKPSKRQLYDASLITQKYAYHPSHSNQNNNSNSWVEHDAPFHHSTREWKDETIWEFRDKSDDKNYKDKPYYGIKGVNRVSNRFIATGCILFMIAGAAFHYVVVKESTGKALMELDEVDKKNINWYVETRKKALASSNTDTLDRLRKEWDKK